MSTWAFTYLMAGKTLRAAEIHTVARCALRQTKELAEDAICRKRMEKKSVITPLKSLIKIALYPFESIVNMPQASTRRH